MRKLVFVALAATWSLSTPTASSSAQDPGWSDFSVHTHNDPFTDDASVFMISHNSQPLYEKAVVVICTADYMGVALGDGVPRIGPMVDVTYRFDNNSAVETRGEAAAQRAQVNIFEPSVFTSFLEGLKRSTRLRFRLENGAVQDVALTGSTAAAREFADGCQQLNPNMPDLNTGN
tara:strand:+ start:432 stop:956 length:525 start_codon:yes stop_codon:yes gene_type:complete